MTEFESYSDGFVYGMYRSYEYQGLYNYSNQYRAECIKRGLIIYNSVTSLYDRLKLAVYIQEVNDHPQLTSGIQCH